MDYCNGLDLNVLINLVENIYDEIAIWDDNYTLLYINKACYRHYGLQPEDLIGKQLYDLIEDEKYWSPSSIPYVYREKKAIIQNQETFLGIDIVTISVPILDEKNNVKYVVQSVRDDYEYLYTKLSPMESYGDDDFNKNNYIIHRSKSMRKIIQFAQKIAPITAPCMILGETGTGKSLLARYIHEISDRKSKPFIEINMASINPSLIESEFFGYKKGAFTGASNQGKKGLFELANGGTLFLDEIGELSSKLQAKLLHVIQEKEIIPIGSIKPIKLDIRIICATNCDLKHMIEVNRFREDLYHRLNVFEINIPPLRERKEDLFTLISHFLNVFNEKYSKNCVFSEKSMDLLMRYPWKGNIRELSNIIERVVVTSDKNTIEATKLPSSFFKINNLNSKNNEHINNLNLSEAIEEVKSKMVKDAYNKYKTTRKVGQALGISQSKACRLIKKYIKE